jgi:predicted phage tail protein
MAPHKREFVSAKVGDRALDLVPRDFPIERADIVCSGRTVEHPQDFLAMHQFTSENEDVILRVVPGGWTAVGIIALTMVSIGLSYAIQALVPPPKPENLETFDNSENSATYAWGGILNTTRNGTVVSICDGEHKAGGQILAAYTDVTDDDRHELFMLIGLGAGPVGAINGFTEDTDTTNGSETGVEGLTGDDIGDSLTLNGTPARLYEGLKVYYRLGEWEQRPIPGFVDTQIEYAQTQDLPKDAAVTYLTQDRVNAIRLIIQFGSGLYRVEGSGALAQKSVQFQVRHRAYGEASWGFPTTFTFSNKIRSMLVKKIEIEDLDPSRYEIEVKRITDDDDVYSMSVAKLAGIVEIQYSDVTRKGQALLAIRHAATEQLSGGLPTVNVNVHGMKRRVYQASDEFGQDTQQDFKTGRNPLLWGWYSLIDYGNETAIEYANAHTFADRTLSCRHTTATCNPRDIIIESPFFYKKITGDFSVTVQCSSSSGLDVGDGVGLCFQDNDDLGDFAFCTVENVGGVFQSHTWNSLRGESTSTFGTDADFETNGTAYIRLVRVGNVWTFSISDDGDTWTELWNTTFAPDADPVRVGLTYYSQTSTTGALQVEFNSFSFIDETSYSLETTANPAWVVYGHASDEFWGIGRYINLVSLDLDTFIGFAAYANGLVDNGRGGLERRFRFDGILDRQRNAWGALLEILENYRATLLKQGDRIRVAWLRVQSGPATQVFADANTKRNSLIVTDETPRLGANVYEVQFLNGETDHEQDWEPYPDPDIEEGEAFRKTTVQHYGVTRASEARRIGLYKCKKSRYQRTVFELKTSVNAIRCEPYDVVDVSAMMLGVGESGRVRESRQNSVTLDKPVTLEIGNTYAIKITHFDDTVETATVTSDIGKRSIVEVDSFDTPPQEGEVWVFGPTETITQPFEITEIEITGGLECKVTGVLYVAGVYDETIRQLPAIDYSALPDPRAFPGDVSALVLTERAQRMKDGSIQNVVDVTFAAGANAVSYDIFYRESGELGWLFAGSTKGLHYVLAGVFTDQTTYEIAVVSVGQFGTKKKPALAVDPGVPFAEIEVVGKTSAPSDVASLTVGLVGDVLVFEWPAVPDSDLLGYQIRYADTDVWDLDDGAVVLVAQATGTSAITASFVPGVTKWFHIRAINTSGVYSDNSAKVQYTIPEKEGQTTTLTRDEEETGINWNGTKTNFAITGDDLLQTADTTTASYETPDGALDASTSAARNVHVDVAHQGDTPAYTWGDADFSWGSSIAANYTWGGAIAGTVTLTIKIRYGDSTPLVGAYEDLIQDGSYEGRYYQIKIEATVTSTATRTRVLAMVTTITE